MEFDRIKKNIGKIIYNDKSGTAFLIDENRVLTARHCLDNYDESKDIYIEFYNISNEKIKRVAKPIYIRISEQLSLDIAILKLESPVIEAEKLKIFNFKIEYDIKWETFGYPNETGISVKGRVNETRGDNYSLYDYDLYLEYENNNFETSGLSGAPVIIDGKIVGIVTDDMGTKNLLGAFSINKAIELFSEANITIFEEAGNPYVLSEKEKALWLEYKENQLLTLEKYLINKTYIKRVEMSKLYEKLKEKDLVLLSGTANTGKSTILYEFIKQYDGIEYEMFILRLDTLSHIKSTKELQLHLGLLESPEKILSGISKNKTGVLIIDQFDAISIYSGRTGVTDDNFIFSIIENAKRLENIKIIISCRSVDLENDHRFKRMIEEGKNNIVNVGLLDKEEVLKIVENLEIKIINELQIELLKNPLNLYLLCELVDSKEIETFKEVKELYDKYWEWKKRKFRQFYTDKDWYEVLGEIVTLMNEERTISVSYSILDKYEEQIQKLITENVLRKIDNKISFFHESFFDYSFARIFFSKKESIYEFVIESDQYLFRRAQIRQLLQFCREENESKYIEEIKLILGDGNIRYHIKEVIFKMLKEFNIPKKSEYKAIELHLYDSKSEFFTESWNIIFSDNWTKFLIVNNLIKDLYEYDEKKIINLLIYFNKDLAENEFAIINSFFEKDSEFNDSIIPNILRMDVSISKNHFELYKTLLYKHTFDNYLNTVYINYNENIKNLKWLELILKYLYQTYPDEKCFSKIDIFISDDIKNNYISEQRKEFINIIDNFLEETQYIFKYGIPDSLYDEEFKSHTIEEKIFDIFILCLIEEAKINKKNVMSIIENYINKNSRNYYIFIFKIFKLGNKIFSNESLNFIIKNIENIKANNEVSNYELYEYIVKNHDNWTKNQLESLEFFLDYYPKYERPRKIKLGGETLIFFYSGHTQFHIFSGLDEKNMSIKIRKKYYELKRKFSKIEEDTVTFSAILSPIAKNKAISMKKENWIKAIKKYSNLKYLKNKEVSSGRLADDLREFSRNEPSKYSELLYDIYLDKDINERFKISIIAGLLESDFLKEKDINEIIEKIYGELKLDSGEELANLIIKNPKIKYSDKSIQIIQDITLNHAEPQNENWKNSKYGGVRYYGGDPYLSGINSTRGKMVQAIGIFLKMNNSKENLDFYLEFINNIIRDKTTAVKSCTSNIIDVYYHFYDTSFALDMLKKVINSSHEEILQTIEINNLLCNILRNHLSEFREVINLMIRSEHKKVRENGALHVGRLFLLEKDIDEELKYCLESGDIDIEKKLVSVFSVNIVNYKDKCETKLLLLANSKFKEVRQQVSYSLSKIIDSNINNYKEFILNYISTLSFNENYSTIVYRLKKIEKITVKIPKFIFEVVKKILFFNSDIDPFTLGELFQIIYLIYEEAQISEKEIINECLDLIDMVFKLEPDRIDDKILKKIERTE
ncbi:trypsin-like peptidase domain-containing protein [Sebaldella termitidis]|uniref:trypsin-like peptidase domain-containing protein n=1 Tax=Sebaldella termitidis TaxID=826 RepID=UPI003EBD32B5